MQLAARPLAGLARGLARAAVLGVVLADDLVGPAEQQLPVVARHAEDPGDHAERERSRDAFDEVELAGSVAARRRIVEDLDRDALDVGALAPHRLGREAPVRDPAHGPVLAADRA